MLESTICCERDRMMGEMRFCVTQTAEVTTPPACVGFRVNGHPDGLAHIGSAFTRLSQDILGLCRFLKPREGK